MPTILKDGTRVWAPGEEARSKERERMIDKDRTGRGYVFTCQAQIALKHYDFFKDKFDGGIQIWYAARPSRIGRETYTWIGWVLKSPKIGIMECRDPHIIEILDEFEMYDLEFLLGTIRNSEYCMRSLKSLWPHLQEYFDA